MPRKTTSSTHWFVVYEDGQPSLATASMSRKNAIKYWLRDAGQTWQFWYRRGFRTKRVLVTWKLL